MEHLQKGSTDTLGAANIETEGEVYEQYIEKFGMETADMLMEEMRKWTNHYTRVVFIDIDQGDQSEVESMARKKAKREGWDFERIESDNRLLKMLVNGDWAEDEFLVVPPGSKITQNYKPGLIEAVKAN